MDENIVNGNEPSQQSFEVDLSALDDNQQVGAQPDDSKSQSDVHTNTGLEPLSIEVDERFKDLPLEEATIRTLQSAKDKIYAQYTKAQQEYAEKDKIVQLFDDMLEDENLLVSFINQVKPDLLAQRDNTITLKEQLKKEFGEDFKPTLSRDEAERDDPFGKDARYYARVDLLRRQLLEGNGNSQNMTVKQYLERKKAQAEAENQKYQAERDAVKQQFKMSDDEMKAVGDWATNLKFADIVKIHRYLRKTHRTPDITNTPGETPGVPSSRDRFLNDLGL